MGKKLKNNFSCKWRVIFKLVFNDGFILNKSNYMKKSIILMCLVIFLISCTDKGIEKQENIPKDYSDINESNAEKNDTEIIKNINIDDIIHISDDDNFKAETLGEIEETLIVHDFWNWLILKMFEGNEVLYFNKKIIFTHDVSQNPIVSWFISKNKEFIIIMKPWRVYTEKNIIFNINDKKIYEVWKGSINQIEKGKSGLYLLLQGPWNQDIIMFDWLWKSRNLYSSRIVEIIENSSEVIFDVNLYGFELMLNKKIKIFYNEGSENAWSDKKEMILDIR